MPFEDRRDLGAGGIGSRRHFVIGASLDDADRDDPLHRVHRPI